MTQTQNEDSINDIRLPCVGVLCIDIAKQLKNASNTTATSYIAASYVKYLQSAGARVVPIWIGREKSYYEKIMSFVNGILIPGGAVYFETPQPDAKLPNDCVRSASIICDIAKNKNDSGDYFPIWGTCLGMQLLLLHSTESSDIRQTCQQLDCLLPLNVSQKEIQKSRMFGNLSEHMRLVLQSPIAYHYHRYCITEDTLYELGGRNQWRVLASSKDNNDLSFISIIEHVRYPFYGVQFHPERICFEYLPDNIQVTPLDFQHCIEASQYFANFFVGDCRKNMNRFTTQEDETRSLIENFPITFTLKPGIRWIQCYLFQNGY